MLTYINFKIYFSNNQVMEGYHNFDVESKNVYSESQNEEFGN